jgi:hypothetical protein
MNIAIVGFFILAVSFLVGRYRFGKLLERAQNADLEKRISCRRSKGTFPPHVETIRFSDR